MTLFKLTLITLLSTTLYAEPTGNEQTETVQIDMHGGKEYKTPSNTVTTKSKIFYGKILEIKGAMGYKYLKIDEEGKELWIAIANAPVTVGDRIGYDKSTMMTNFKSKSLDQEFKEIFFASDVYLPKKVQKPASMKDMLGLSPAKEDPHAGITQGVSAEPKEEKPATPFVKKDTYTIEEIHMWRKSLEGQIISIEGSVYKVSRQIMNLDWVHLGDGTGDEKKLTDDLIFTASTANVKSGDKVIAKGKVVVNKDFGFGYFYKVIIQNASFQVK